MKLVLDRYRHARVTIALSGGVDSVVLLHAFKAQAAENEIALSAVHIEHGIRGDESLRDLQFCEALCKTWGVPLTIVRASVPARAKEERSGLEEAARRVRYEVFRRLLSEGQADYVATAHHMGDVAETVLFRLARGTALSGMRAIEEGGGIVRPLLAVTREEIEAYARAHDLPHIEDSTNSDESYHRNYIRHTVLPALEKVSGNAEEHIVRFAALAAEDDELLCKLAAKKIIRRSAELAVPIELSNPLFSRACVLCMRELGLTKDYSGANLEEVARLRSLQSGRKASLPNGLEAVREHDTIVFYRRDAAHEEVPFTANAGTVYEGSRFKFSVSSEDGGGALTVDLDAFPAGCVVRSRREGDVITPYHAPHKTLKKFLSDKKIPARVGKQLPLIAKGNEILVVVGVEISDKVKVTSTTKRIGYLL